MTQREKLEAMADDIRRQRLIEAVVFMSVMGVIGWAAVDAFGGLRGIGATLTLYVLVRFGGKR